MIYAGAGRPRSTTCRRLMPVARSPRAHSSASSAIATSWGRQPASPAASRHLYVDHQHGGQARSDERRHRGHHVRRRSRELVRATFDTGPVIHQATIAYNRFWREWRRANFNGFPEPASNIYAPIYGSAPNPAFIPTPSNAREAGRPSSAASPWDAARRSAAACGSPTACRSNSLVLTSRRRSLRSNAPDRQG